MTKQKVVIALGGNAIQTGNGATAEDQKNACYQTAKQLAHISKLGHDIVITHGNGPQVGNIVLQQQLNQSEKLPAMPLDTCGAMSQGMIGYWLQNALYEVFQQEGINRTAATTVTQVVVDQNDPAFQHPTKPIGSFYDEAEAKELMEIKGYTMKEDAGRGYRRLVPSPKPLDIIEKDMIQFLVDHKFVVIAGGGGGIPVAKHEGKLIGVEAVIDKDLTTEKIAELIDADTLLILTAVEKIFLHFGSPQQQDLEQLTYEEAVTYKEQGHFAPGSMLPKVEAALAFVNSKPGRKAIITSLDKAYDAVLGKAGTTILSKEACLS
ncbi:carbamate kinase [Pontibacillus yanchengensis]|uniref:Carbamate kinase n=1 Tax=Pontibacillus yanchengensis TaxID=462910 RepID=A0ACC7VHX0_9BACI|nr:carbamate kinase [Pontibacillus yanchengensis]MYL54290.1 carbamate kinase [Pontibacillus yanchengensis]